MPFKNLISGFTVDRAAAGPAGGVGPEREAAHQGGRQQAQGHQRPPVPGRQDQDSNQGQTLYCAFIYIKWVWLLMALSSLYKKLNKFDSKCFSGIKGRVPRDFSTSGFFTNQFSPGPWVSHQGRFRFFQKFAEIFTDQGAPPVSLTLVANGKNLHSEKF